jgi:TonB-dependent SusC/RagA subfamily outer membrane receptor
MVLTMPNKRHVAMVGALMLTATIAAAQPAPSCSGPGIAFGVTSYRCASCGVKQSPGVRTQFVFEAEPVVLETTVASMLEAGDVVVAVDRKPIMTQAGSDAFTYPTASSSIVTVRRGGQTSDVEATTLACRVDSRAAVASSGEGLLTVVDGVVVPTLGGVPRSDIESVEVLKGPLAASLYGANASTGVIIIKTKSGKPPEGSRQSTEGVGRQGNAPLIIIDGVPQTVSPAIAATPSQTTNANFGFALECPTSCGRSEWRGMGQPLRFETHPRVVELAPNGAAEQAGMRVGDVVTHIDGQSVLGKQGMQLTGDGRSRTMRVTVKRAGSEVNFTLNAR